MVPRQYERGSMDRYLKKVSEIYVIIKPENTQKKKKSFIKKQTKGFVPERDGGFDLTSPCDVGT